ncbi:MAG: transketolase [Actinobacteria bacterium HGW-Actinobacteria-6]|nr:MAG: transketolase [Actinobacteria bacterium HGW-Actinobacteria-6]
MAQVRTSDELRELARRMRCDIVRMLTEAGSGHPGGSLSAADITATLYGAVMRHDAANPALPERDRFVLSKGHAAPVLYAALAEEGYFDRKHLATLRKLGSILQGHPDCKKTPGVEVSTGSLGQGLAISNGMALGLRLDGATEPTVYCLLGDGELQEGEVWEAAMFAPHHGLTNVVAIIDNNGLQIDGSCNDVMCLGEIGRKFAAFGWDVVECDGHDIDALLGALGGARARAEACGKPVAVVCATVKGKGVSFMEDLAEWHGKTPTAEQAAAALAELGCEGEEAR